MKTDLSALTHPKAPMLTARIYASSDMQAQTGKGAWIAEHFEGFADRVFVGRVRCASYNDAEAFVRSCGYIPANHF